MIGVNMFTNSALLICRSNPVAGDMLVITGSRTAALLGPGTYMSNGGSLSARHRADEGGPATRSDTSVVDGTTVGDGGGDKDWVTRAPRSAACLTL